MHPRVRFDDITHLADSKPKRSVFERFLHLTFPEWSKITSVGMRGAV